MNIEIDGVDYDLNVEKAKQSGALVKSIPHRVGNHYKVHPHEKLNLRIMFVQ